MNKPLLIAGFLATLVSIGYADMSDLNLNSNTVQVNPTDSISDSSVRISKKNRTDSRLPNIFDMGGRYFVDAALEVGSGIQADKYIELVGLSTTTTPSTGHARVYLSSSTRNVNVRFDNGSTVNLSGGITGVTAGLGLLGGGTSGSVTLNLSTPVANGSLDSSSVTLQGNTFNGASQLLQLNSNSAITITSASITNLYNSTGIIQATSIVGSKTNDNAGIGYLGEYISSTSVDVVNCTTSFSNVVQSTITAGDWDCMGNIVWQINGATANGSFDMGLSLKSGSVSTDMVVGQNISRSREPATANSGCSVPIFRVSTAASATVHLKQLCNVSVGTPRAVGAALYCRRVR